MACYAWISHSNWPPLVTDVFLGQYVDKPLHELFKELRDKTYRQEMAFLTKSWKDWQKQHKQDASKGLPMWPKSRFEYVYPMCVGELRLSSISGAGGKTVVCVASSNVRAWELTSTTGGGTT